MLRLDSDVQYVKGVGPRRASLLASRDIRTVQDLLLHLPKSYQDRAHFIPVSGLKVGQDAAVHARVYRSRVIQTRTRGRILDVVLTDGAASRMPNGSMAAFSRRANSAWAARSCSSAASISIAMTPNLFSSIPSLSFSKTALNPARSILAGTFLSTKKWPASRAASFAEPLPELFRI